MCANLFTIFLSAIALFTSVLQSIFATIIGFGDGDSPFLCQFNYSGAILVPRFFIVVDLPVVFGKLAGLLALITWIWIAVL